MAMSYPRGKRAEGGIAGKKRSLRLFFIAALILAARFFVLQPFRTTGSSREPCCYDGNIVVADKLTYLAREPRRGEIVVFRTNDKPYLYFLKRVIGLPGENVEIRDGLLLVDGRNIREWYLAEANDWNVGPLKVRDDSVFVIGDNRSMPEYDHLFTQVALKNIVGRVLWKK